jgi:hypothetical protein
MTPKMLLTATAFSALIAGSALAQDTTEPMPATEPNPAAEAAPMTEPVAPSATDATAPAGAVVRQSSPTPVDQAYTLKAGDPTVTSNGPVPDTAENRAAYGGPDSRGGKQTKPAGN